MASQRFGAVRCQSTWLAIRVVGGATAYINVVDRRHPILLGNGSERVIHAAQGVSSAMILVWYMLDGA